MSQVIELRAVHKQYASGVQAVAGINLTVAEGCLLALLGPSGCGKTTTLRLIAGLDRPDHGTILVGGRTVAEASTWVAPEQRRVGLVFQDGALFPHLNVADNVGFALHGLARPQRQQRIEAMLDLVNLAGLGTRFPHQLSGGQQQRVALARALANEPAVVLLDEPFANLDVALRVELREEVAQILRTAGTTTILVTHDQQEALSLADQVALMLEGQIAQHGSPQELYSQPVSPAVANFLGDANWFPGEAHGPTVQSALGPLVLLTPMHGAVTILVRPEQITLQPNPAGPWQVQQVRYFGHDQLVTVTATNQTPLQARTSARLGLTAGLPVQLAITGAVQAYPA
ncbi:MAG: ABC transporter ATP-binding protein [Oscillochloridaceae bacterium umkhey_bin13]